ncbi:MAG: Arylsulfatase [Candidatus Marinimicrobia bacterium]|nr:Arylsulfatase [Candidatus Neomarinimicrobiota bacterium]
MSQQNLIFITLDAVRPDHFSCYGYDRFETKGIDEIAAEGTLFENNICASCLTPISHATMLTGKQPQKHGIRHPFSKVKSKTITEMMKEQGYSTAGFVGINFLGSTHGFAKGFDYYNEPTSESSWNSKEYKKDDETMQTLWGNWWIPDMLDWMQNHDDKPFFIWAHYFEVHFLSEKWLLYSGKMPKDELSDWAYYDGKLKYMDEHFIQPMNQQLKDLGIWDNTAIALTSDHGETLGPDNPNWEDYYFNYPQHKTMLEDDIRVPLIFKGADVPKGKRIKNTTTAVDLVPTILDFMDIDTEEEFDGRSLTPLFHDEELDETVAYGEELYEERGKGPLQFVRTDTYKLIRNPSAGEEEFYNLAEDPGETDNRIEKLTVEEAEVAERFRKIMTDQYEGYRSDDAGFTDEESKKIEERLRDLGYI